MMSSLILEARTLARSLSAIYTKLWFSIQSTPSSMMKSEEKATTFRSCCLAIKGSRLSIVVFSQNYASSTWCLKEPVQILEFMDTQEQIMVPVFYQVNPSQVRKLEESFAETFSKHEQDSNASMEEVRHWRFALTRAANLSGWDSRDYKDDAKLIENIVQDTFKKLINISSSENNGLIGMYPLTENGFTIMS